MAIDLTSKQFGRLIALKPTEKRLRGSVVWKCKCECGEYIETTAKALRGGNKRSCGCLQKESAKKFIEKNVHRNQKTQNKIKETKNNAMKEKLIGKKFGRLTVTEQGPVSESSNGIRRVFWKCKCECGNEVISRSDWLQRGESKSCGCYHKDHVVPIINEIRKKNLVEKTKLDTLTAKIRKDNKTGVKGVSYLKNERKYIARIKFQQKVIQLGRFDTLQEAKEARQKAEEEYFKPMLEKYGRKYEVSK